MFHLFYVKNACKDTLRPIGYSVFGSIVYLYWKSGLGLVLGHWQTVQT